MQTYIIDEKQAGQRFDKFLNKYLPNAGTGFLFKMLRKKNITLNGKKAEGKEILSVGDEVRFFFAEETFQKFTATASQSSASVKEYEHAYKLFQNASIGILYEDEDVLILNKPAGILTQKASDQDSSLNEWMIGYLLHNRKMNANDLQLFKPSVCNRLDRNTSGIVLCGISLKGSQVLSKLIHDREVKKFYRTICKGILTEKVSLKGSLIKNEKTNTVTFSPKGEEIQTAYEPIKSLKYGSTYLEVELITGKTHQIRAHLSGIGHPLMGDKKYGNDAYNKQANKHIQLNHQLLHAYRVEFPTLSDDLSNLSNKTIIAPIPQYFERILEDLS